MTSASDHETVRVGLGARSYDIQIGAGLLENAGSFLTPLLNRRRVVVVTDENVARAQGERLASGLDASKIAFDQIALPAGEATKSFAQLDALTGRLLDLGVERGDLVVALGGGVIGDLVGFAAAVLRRGCRFAQVPTTLLAQVDSSVGGKTAINVAQGKNLIGAFHQPSLVIADTAALETLPPRDLRAGYAEVVKYGAIGDMAFFEWLEANGAALLNGDEPLRRAAVKKSCEAKAAIVAADEREAGERALLNLGHTFGHAFEAFYQYSDALLHGEAVALGMVLAFEYSAAQGLGSLDAAKRLATHLRITGLPTAVSDVPQRDGMTAERLLELMLQDKKVDAGALTLILAADIGAARIVKNAATDDLKEFLKEKIAAARR
jgi:3-dehydroquinate synthase